MPERKPHVMLTFLEVVAQGHGKRSGSARDRLRQHVMRKKGVDPESKIHSVKPRAAAKAKVKKIKAVKVGYVY